MVWLLYGVTLVLGLVAALPFYGTLLAEGQNSPAFMKLLDGFDYTVYSDFMHRSQRAIDPLLRVGRWLGVLYVFMSVLLAGGILTRFAEPAGPFQTGLFWEGCRRYVGRFVGLFGVTFLFVLAGAVIWLVAGTLAVVVLSDSMEENGLFWLGLAFFGLFLLTATWLLCIGDYAKVLIVRENERNPFRAFGRAGRLVRRNLGQTLGLYWLLILAGTALFGSYFLIDGLVLMSGWLTIGLMLLVQQAVILARAVLKVWSLGVAWTVYEGLPKPAPASPVVHAPVAVDDPLVFPETTLTTVAHQPGSDVSPATEPIPDTAPLPPTEDVPATENRQPGTD